MDKITETVPAVLRGWSVNWPEYQPTAVTPPGLLPEALARQVPVWAEAAAMPDGASCHRPPSACRPPTIALARPCSAGGA
ncbi:hypothetical protein [Streptomyces xanthophaeus]